jgi:hypothetical protein
LILMRSPCAAQLHIQSRGEGGCPEVDNPFERFSIFPFILALITRETYRGIQVPPYPVAIQIDAIP